MVRYGGEDEKVRNMFVIFLPLSLLSLLSALSHTKFPASFRDCSVKEFSQKMRGRKRNFHKKNAPIPVSVPVLRSEGQRLPLLCPCKAD